MRKCAFLILFLALLLLPALEPARADNSGSEALKKKCLTILRDSIKSGDVDTRRSTTQFLYELPPEECIPLLDEALGARDERVINGALYAIGKMKCPETKKLIARALTLRTPGVEETVLQIIGETGRLSDLPYLKEEFKKRKGPGKLYAAASMGLLGDMAGLSFIEESAQGRDVDIKREALFFLGKLGDKAALPLLRKEAAGEDRETARMALLALGYFNDKESLPLLQKALQSKDDACKGAAVMSLGRRHDKDTWEALSAMYADPDWRIRNDVVDVLTAFGPEGDTLLAKAAEDPHFLVRIKAATALARKGDSHALEILKGSLSDQDEMVRKFAVRGIGELSGQEFLPLVIPLIDDESAMVRPEAARAALKLMAAKKR